MKAALGFLIALVACAEAPASSAPTVAAPQSDAPQASVAAPADTGWPTGFDKLGSPCQGADFDVTLGTYTGRASCGANGVVSQIRWKLADVVESPAASHVIADRSVSGTDALTTLRISDDAVWMRSERPTARVSGWTFMGVPRWMSDDQLADAQRLAGLPESPLLRSGAAWKEALVASGPIPPPGP